MRAAVCQATVGNFIRLFGDPAFLDACLNTFWFALVGTVVSTVIGFLAALVLERLDLPFRRTLKVLFLSPMFVSALIMAFAWSMLYGPSGYAAILIKSQLGIALPSINSLGGMGLLAGIVAAPISYLFFAAAMANIPPSLEDAARAAGATPLRAIATVVFPLLRPSLLYCVLLNFVLKIDHLAVPLLFGAPSRIQVLATYLYDKSVANSVDYGLVSSTAVIMLLIIQLFILAQKKLLGDVRRYTTVGGRNVNRGLVKVGILG